MHVLVLRFPMVLVSGRAETNGEVHAQGDVAIAMVAHGAVVASLSSTSMAIMPSLPANVAVDSRGRLHCATPHNRFARFGYGFVNFSTESVVLR